MIRRRHGWALFAFAPVVLVALPLHADESPATQPDIAVQAFGAANPDCREWGDACVICRRSDDAPACSMPGIACVAEPPLCRASAAKP